MIVFEPLGSAWVHLKRRECYLLAWQQLDSGFLFLNTRGKVLVEKLVLFFLSQQSGLFHLLKLMLSWACTDRKKLELEKCSIPRKHE